MNPDLSIIIPAYNRVEILKYSLESISHAIKHLKTEVIVVDDGSKDPLESQLKNFLNLPLRFVRQANQGSIVARNRGLNGAEGKYILFLDSDDLVHPDKLISQVSCLEKTGAEVCYTDDAVVTLKGDYNSLLFRPSRILPVVTHPAEFYLKVQPIPSNPIYRKSYLQHCLTHPIVSVDRVFDPVGDVWLLYNLAIYPAQIQKVAGHYSIYGEHEQERYTSHWEKLGVASLAVTLAFIKNCPDEDATLEARKLVGQAAFISWRKLPKNFNAEFEAKVLEIWEKSPKGNLADLGGHFFQRLAEIVGAKKAAFVLRQLQRPDYSKIQTVTPEELQAMMSGLTEQCG